MHAKDTTPDLDPSIDYCIRKLLGINANVPITIEHGKRFLSLCFGLPQSVMLEVPEQPTSLSNSFSEASVYRFTKGIGGLFASVRLTDSKDGIKVALWSIKSGLIAKFGRQNAMSIRSGDSSARIVFRDWLPPEHVLVSPGPVNPGPKCVPMDVVIELRHHEFFQLQLGWPPRKERDYVRVTLEELVLLQSPAQGKVGSERENNSMPAAARARFSVHTHMQSLGELGKLIRGSPEGEQLCQNFLSERSKETKPDSPQTDRIVKCALAPEEDFRWLEWV